MDSDTVIVVSPEKYAHIDDDSLTDCSNIVAVQNLYRYKNLGLIFANKLANFRLI
jgi:hypothetical protein